MRKKNKHKNKPLKKLFIIDTTDWYLKEVLVIDYQFKICHAYDHNMPEMITEVTMPNGVVEIWHPYEPLFDDKESALVELPVLLGRRIDSLIGAISTTKNKKMIDYLDIELKKLQKIKETKWKKEFN